MSELVQQVFEQSSWRVTVIPLRFAMATSDIGTFRFSKLLTLAKVIGALFCRCIHHKPELVYFTLTPCGNAFYRDLLLVAILKLFRVRRLYHLHGKGIREASQGWIQQVLYRWAFAGAQVAFLAPCLLDDAAEFVKQSDSYVLANGITDLAGQRAICRSLHGAKVPRILFLSNMVVSKGPFILLEALALLHREAHGFEAVFSGAWQSQQVEQDFYARVSELGLHQSVAYIGPKFGTDKNGVLAGADIFAFPTCKDTFPLVILEAMAFGLPVVSTREGAIPDIVVDGETGFLVPKRDVMKLAAQLRILLVDHGLRVAMGQAGRARYEEKFTLETFETNLLRIAEACLHSTGSAQ